MNIVQSIISCQCPRCRKADLFVRPFRWSKPLDMPEKCPVCGLNFEPEPGFYWGAMFVSYGLYSLTLTPFALLLVFGFGWTGTQAITFVLLFTLFTFIGVARLARSVWIHIIVGKDKQIN